MSTMRYNDSRNKKWKGVYVMRALIGKWIDKIFDSHIVERDQLERDLHDWKVKAAKLENENFKLQMNELRYDDTIRELTRKLSYIKDVLQDVVEENNEHGVGSGATDNGVQQRQTKITGINQRNSNSLLVYPWDFRRKQEQ